jgi:serine/threonine protein kinase
MGLCKPANYNESEIKLYGVLGYLAPEILRGQNYTKASDIYSFGILMYEFISELPPYHDNAHDLTLALNICEGVRPEFKIKVPKLILHLIKNCLDAEPSNRPNARDLLIILEGLVFDMKKWENGKSELIKQIEETEKINNKPPVNDLPLKIHPEAIYKSRPLNFKDLPEPKNSDDYYEMYDNISSKKYSTGIK